MQINRNITPAFWVCPSCQTPLEKQNNVWRCSNLHSFDCAKEGYVNLLLAQQKSSKDPGDNKDMVSARREFLEQDYYLPLATEIAQLLLKHRALEAGSKNLYSVYDAGCGEGYYLAKIKQLLAADGVNVIASGSDISKPAIQKAAKKHPNIQYAVASSFNLPVVSDSQNAVIQIFAPSDSKEIQRLLKKGGVWLKVTPASQHLYELKQRVYEQAIEHEVEALIPEGFELLSQSHVQFTMSIASPQHRENLLMMTPFYWTISAQNKRLLLEELDTVSADFTVSMLLNHGI
jgi:23S rRNA (guanine745-N1)-methyltransferase